MYNHKPRKTIDIITDYKKKIKIIILIIKPDAINVPSPKKVKARRSLPT
jgi:hypothetical protein